MSGNSKVTLAIVLGAVGLLLGLLGTVTAYNAKQAVDSDLSETGEVHALVEQKFQEAQSRQDKIEASQRSDAEKFVAQLTKGESSLLRKISGNHKDVNKLRRQTRKLRNQLNTLNNRNRELNNEIARVENDQNADYNQLNQRINKTNKQVRNLQNQVSNLRGLVGN